MRYAFAIVAAAGLALGSARDAKAQFNLSIGGPYGGGISIGSGYGGYGLGYGGLGYGGYGGYGLGYGGLGYGGYPYGYSSGYYGLGAAPLSTTVYSSGYYGGVSPFYGTSYGYGYGYPSYGVYRRGFIGRRFGRWW